MKMQEMLDRCYCRLILSSTCSGITQSLRSKVLCFRLWLLGEWHLGLNTIYDSCRCPFHDTRRSAFACKLSHLPFAVELEPERGGEFAGKGGSMRWASLLLHWRVRLVRQAGLWHNLESVGIITHHFLHGGSVTAFRRRLHSATSVPGIYRLC